MSLPSAQGRPVISKCIFCGCRDEVDSIGTGHASETFGLLDSEQPIRVGSTVGPKAHVLVCAPSNSALDEIVGRLLQHGVLDWCAPSPRLEALLCMLRWHIGIVK